MKHCLITALFFLTAKFTLPAGVIEFTVNGTANSAGMGYTAGQPVSFTFTLNDFAPTSPVGFLDLGAMVMEWYDEDSSTDPELWSDVRGTGVSGTWTRPATTIHSPFSDIFVRTSPSGYLSLYAGTDDTGPYDTGITVNGVNGPTVHAISMAAAYNGLDFSIPETLPDPTDHFESRLGTYEVASQSDASIRYWNGSGDSTINFTISGLTISSVPEPSTWLAAGFAGVVLVGRHGRRLLGRLRGRT